MKRVLFLVIGIMIMGFSTALCNFTGLGIDPINAFAVAVSKLLNMQLGLFLLILQFVIAIGVFIFKRENIGVGTIFPMITFGYFLQFFNWLLPTFLPKTENILINLLLFIIGMLILAFGMSMYMSCDFGMVPYDSIAYTLSDLTGKKVAAFRVSVDVLVAIIAFILKGPIGIGTVLLAFSIGPLIDLYRKKIFTNKKETFTTFN